MENLNKHSTNTFTCTYIHICWFLLSIYLPIHLCKYVRIKTCEKVLAPNRAESKLSRIHAHTPINAYEILLTSSQHQAGLSVELNNKASSFVARTYYEMSGDKAENDIMRIKCVILHNKKQKHTDQAYIWMCSTIISSVCTAQHWIWKPNDRYSRTWPIVRYPSSIKQKHWLAYIWKKRSILKPTYMSKSYTYIYESHTIRIKKLNKHESYIVRTRLW